MSIMRLTTILGATLGLLLVGCAKSTSIGTDIFEQDQVGLQFVDTFTIRTATIQSPNELAYGPTTATQFKNFRIGHFADPVFGTTKADFYFQVRLTENAPPSYSENDVLDSVILKLEYDLKGLYGDITKPQKFEVYRVTENMDANNVFYSDQTFAVANDPVSVGNVSVGTFMFTPDTTSSVFSYVVGDTIGLDNERNQPSEFIPHLRINLTEALGREIMDISAVLNDEGFLDTLRGFVIRPVGDPADAMMSFKAAESAISELTLYYTDTTSTYVDAQMNVFPILRSYNYEIAPASVKFNNFQTETATEINDAVAGGIEEGEDLLYLQGMDGPDVSVQIPYISGLKDKVVVNRAELIFTIEEQPSPLLYPSAKQLTLFYLDEDENEIFIDDFVFSNARLNLTLFGGQPEVFTTNAGTTLSRYRMNISAHLQKMINETVPNTLILKVDNELVGTRTLQVSHKPEEAGRVVLKGAGDPEFPVILNVNYTNLN